MKIYIYKKKWYGKLKLIHTFDSKSLEIVVSSAGVLTVRKKRKERESLLALSPKEWSYAYNDSIDYYRTSGQLKNKEAKKMKDFYVMLDDMTASELFTLVGHDWYSLDDFESLILTNQDCALFSLVNGSFHFQHFGWSQEFESNGWTRLTATQADAVKMLFSKKE